ncbi:TIGR01244 family phosphatase, partial [Acinetobacter baumannii]
MSICSVHDKFHRPLSLSGFCLLKVAIISLNSSVF